MGINRFSFEDKSRNWKLEMTDFQQLTLLVGASGVGKTQILRSIQILKNLSDGQSYSDIHWYLDFTTIDKNNYIWQGSFEKQDIRQRWEENSEKYIRNKPKILTETVLLNNHILADRDAEKIIFEDKETIKLLRYKSLVHLLMEQEPISSFYRELTLISANYYEEIQQNSFVIQQADYSKLLTKYNTIHKIRNSQLNTLIKLLLLQQNEKALFLKIQTRFCDIFPQVESIEMDLMAGIHDMYFPSVVIREKNVIHAIQEHDISAGMMRSLMLISELYLSPEGTIFLIDEFENSLGINCLDELVSDILRSKRNLQFILTSHHPYIINNINFNHWKVVTRNGGVVKTHNAAHFHLGKSKHTAFMQLIQLEAYQTGSETSL